MANRTSAAPAARDVESWVLKVYKNHQLAYTGELPATLEIGRQSQGEPPPCQQVESGGGPRLVVEHRSENTVSRKHCLLTTSSNGKVSAKNLSARVPAYFDRQDDSGVTRSLGIKERITMPSLSALNPGDDVLLSPPFLLVVGTTSIQVEPAAPYESSGQLKALSDKAPTPVVVSDDTADSFPSFFQSSGESKDRDSVLRWLQRTMGVFQQSASNADFLPQAARAIIDTVGLDIAGILTYEDDKWQTRTVVSRDEASEAAWHPSTTILNEVLKEKRTYRQLPDQAASAQSLRNVSALVVAPMVDTCGNVLGAVYGDRRISTTSKRGEEISELEAKLVELLACGVAAGLARLKQEQAALAARVRFEQFFTPQLFVGARSRPRTARRPRCRSFATVRRYQRL